MNATTTPINALLTVIDTYSGLQTFFEITSFLIIILLGLASYLFWFWKKERRFYINRKRPIKIFYSKGSSVDMQMETKTLRDSGFFKIPEDPSSNYQDCHNLNEHGLVIVGYTPGMEGLGEIVTAVKAKRIPLIVYTKEMLTATDKALLETYPWYSLCNVPLRVVSDTFTILSTFPNEKQ